MQLLMYFAGGFLTMTYVCQVLFVITNMYHGYNLSPERRREVCYIHTKIGCIFYLIPIVPCIYHLIKSTKIALIECYESLSPIICNIFTYLANVFIRCYHSFKQLN